MLFSDNYFTIQSPAEGTFRDRGSKFIAFIFPVLNDPDVKLKLQNIKKEHPSATHHCYAYILGADKSAYRVNDDGEPSGSAGKPIYNALLSKDLTNTMIIVVRYFGGTQLGIPGLINAYKSASLDAISKAKIIEKYVEEIYELSFNYECMNDVMRIIKNYQLEVIEQKSEEKVAIKIAVRKSLADELQEFSSKIINLECKYLYTR